VVGGDKKGVAHLMGEAGSAGISTASQLVPACAATVCFHVWRWLFTISRVRSCVHPRTLANAHRDNARRGSRIVLGSSSVSSALGGATGVQRSTSSHQVTSEYTHPCARRPHESGDRARTHLPRGSFGGLVSSALPAVIR
jgi:hypothetical protein